MWLQINLLFCVFVIINSLDIDDSESKELEEGERKLSETILMMLEHFKEPDPVGLPGVDIPDPYPIPSIKQSVTLGTMLFNNTAVHGISKFRIVYVNAEIKRMEVQAALILDVLQARGDYIMTSWFGITHGPFTVDITGLLVTARASLDVKQDGKLKVKDIDIDLKYNTINANFKNLGMFGGMVQSIVNNGGSFLFDTIKPYILKEAYTKARKEITTKLDEVTSDLQFPNSIAPLDMAIIDARKKVRDVKLDPFQIKDFNKTVSIFAVNLYNTWLTGISSFQRVGNITLKMENKTFIADFEIGTQELAGKTQWDISAVCGLMSKAGTASFSVEYINARIILAQSLDTRKQPVFKDLKLDIGNIQVRCDGLGTIDYLIEFGVNVVPNLLRYQLINALEGPTREKVQKTLDIINVDNLIRLGLPKLDEMINRGFQSPASDAKTTRNVNDDDFFNF